MRRFLFILLIVIAAGLLVLVAADLAGPYTDPAFEPTFTLEP